MIRFMAVIAALLIVTAPAQAKKHKHTRVSPQIALNCISDNSGRTVCGGPVQRATGHATRSNFAYDRADPRPSLWCAWWLRRKLGIPRTAFPNGSYNQARAFARIGTPAPKGCTDCIAVFSRGRGGHVGLVERWDANGNPVILSGNFNGRVDTAPHPARRLIALRWPP